MALLLDTGEASALALALSLPTSLLIIDDAKGRKIAQQLGLRITGTVGVLLKAKAQGIVPAVKPLLNSMQALHFHLSHELVNTILRQAGEA